ncbi:hypothetical protein phi1422_0049 [Bdellovibrio phage phi1422]|uniref:hypothetical protein n=1 Tax=Bdellovibrio phage phi1422 TaxID=1127515 RepID=UPI0002536D65|nr:hypothetical protein F395_gp49 [Bdellovibrio phage phi1422]AFC22569.1 hypothetical protein phi1422_0049 [Bdellovibrio phage phi1422]
MQSVNQFGMNTEKGVVAMKMETGTFSVQIDATEAAELVPGQAVKLVDSAGGIPKVVKVAADTDEVFGFINYNKRQAKFKAGDVCEISGMRGNVMWMQAASAVARGAKVMVVVAGNKVDDAAAGAKTIIGWAFDKATAADQLIRVVIDLPGDKTAP